MKLLLIAMSTFTALQTAHTAVIPGWDRPLQTAEMKITHAEFSLADVRNVNLTLTRKDGPAVKEVKGATDYGITVKYSEPNEKGVLIEKTKSLIVTDVSKDSCGSTVYQAALFGNDKNPMGARFNVTLVDHQTRLCEDYRPYLWEATVREGFGWCGTGDGVLELIGNPEYVYTPTFNDLSR